MRGLRVKCDVRISSRIAALAAAIGAFVGTGPAWAQGAESARRSILAEHLESGGGSPFLAQWGPGIVGTLYLGGAVAIAASAEGNRHADRERVWFGSAVGLSAVSFGGYLLPGRYRSAAVVADIGLLGAASGLGLALLPRATPRFQVMMLSMGGASLAYTTLSVVDAALKPPPDPVLLDRYRHQLESSEAISPTELAAIEREFALTRRPVPRITGSFVALAGTAGILTAAFWPGGTKDEALLGVGLAAPTVVPLVISFSTSGRPWAFDAYNDSLRNVRLAPIGPEGSAGLSLSGRFH